MFVERYIPNYMLVHTIWIFFIVLGFNNTSTLVGHFVLSPRVREKRDSRGNERMQGWKQKFNKKRGNPHTPIQKTSGFDKLEQIWLFLFQKISVKKEQIL